MKSLKMSFLAVVACALDQVREAKPGEAISIIETDCQVDFEAPKDYKEPVRQPQIVRPPEPMQHDQAAATAAAAPEEPEEPTFVPFVGSGRRLDGKAVTASPTPPPAAASAAAAAAAARAAGPGPSSSSGTSKKAGTFVSTGNRLLDKLAQVGRIVGILFLIVAWGNCQRFAANGAG